MVGSSQSSHDVHLEDYDEEVYDDDDFYHQVNECTSSCQTFIFLSCGIMLLHEGT